MNKGLAEMFRYNAWANRALFEACRSLTEAQLDTHVPGISGSIRDLLMHIAGGQQTFVLRTKGRHHEGELGRWVLSSQGALRGSGPPAGKVATGRRVRAG